MDTSAIFPEEITFIILTRLPAKSLHRFKCVSKHWLSLITSPYFLKAYSTLSPPHPPSWILTHRDSCVLPANSSPTVSFSLPEPPDISHLILSGLPRTLTHPEAPAIVTSSNGLILYADQRHELTLINPVTGARAVLPGLGKVRYLPHVALAARYTPTYNDVSIVVIQLQGPKDPSKEAAIMLIYSSDTGEWETRTAFYKAGSERAPYFWKADSCFEANGKIFWLLLSCGVLVLDDPFGERMELRFIPLPKGYRKPYGTPNLLQSRFLYQVGDFVCFFTKEKEKFWRLTDVEKGKWSLAFETADGYLAVPKGFKKLRLSAFHPLEPEVAVMNEQDKFILVNLKEAKVVGNIGTCQLCDRDNKDRALYPVVLPPWPTPIPRRLSAVTFKESGNKYFQSNKFEDALFYYSRSISYLPTAVAYANRAAANLQLGQYQEAENDCSEALKLDDQYWKVYVRRATARKELGKLLEAKEDVGMAFKVDGGQYPELLKLSSEINCLLEKLV